MKELIELGLMEKTEKVLVSTRKIADNFDKEHKEVIYAIEGRKDALGKVKNNGLIEEISGISHPSNYFIKSHYYDSLNRKQDEYLLTRDGFTLLAMGFNGKKALEWKIKYIQAFNMMEASLRERQTTEWQQTRENGKLIRRKETDALALLKIYAEDQREGKPYKHIYVNYTNRVNKAVGIEPGERKSASFKQLQMVSLLEDMIENTVQELIEMGVYYKEIFKRCQQKVEVFASLMYLDRIA